MVLQGVSRRQAVAVWQPLLGAPGAAPADFTLSFSPLKIVSIAVRTFWAPSWPKRLLGFIRSDDRPGAPAGTVLWRGDQGKAGRVLQACQSTWLPAALLQAGRRQALGDALFAASRHAGVALHHMARPSLSERD